MWRALAIVAFLAVTALPVRAETRVSPLAEGRAAVMLQGQRYGTLPDAHATTLKVREIFERIVRAAGRRPGVALEVYVLDTPRIIAEALPGGLVTVSSGLIDLTGGDHDALAFVLAHEVAHQVRDHHAILDSLGVLGASVSSQRQEANEHVVRAYQVIELDADRLGVLFAALAGYRATAAIPTVVLLAERSGPDRFHPTPGERARAIRAKITEVYDHLEVFHLGIFLITSGRALDGVRVLEHFLTLFPSREVLSAVGVGYHREALRYMPPAQFRHALVVDGVARAATARGASTPFRRFMDRALHYYRLAADADPDYAPVLSNLGAAYLDLGDRDLAQHYLNRALRADRTLAAAYNNRAVLALEAGDVRPAEHDLLIAAKRSPSLPVVAANLSRLYDLEGRADDARRWRVRGVSAAADAARRPETIGTLVPGMPTSQLPDWLASPEVRRIKIPLGTSPGQDLTLLVAPSRGVAVLVKDNAVEAVSATSRVAAATTAGLRPGDRVARVEAVYGTPGGLQDVHAFDVWAYPSRALTVFTAGDRVQAVWVGRPAVNERETEHR